jgi:L-alanine-DL-glutamate epimerase-like enolase superfamily enzyme
MNRLGTYLPSRRDLFRAAVGAGFLSRYHQIAAAEKGRARISDVQVMIMQGGRTYTMVKIVSDAGVYGIGEAYGSPGIGVKEQILSLKPWLIGKDPL